MNYSLEGKAAIVTGAAGGIGGAIAKAFKEAGAQVACVDLSVDKIGREYLPIRCDVSAEPVTIAHLPCSENLSAMTSVSPNKLPSPADPASARRSSPLQ